MDLKPTEEEDIELQYRTIESIAMYPDAEFDYLGITTGDSLEKVIQTIGSPNKEILFELVKDQKGYMHMYYTDSEKKITLQIQIRLDLNNEEEAPARVISLVLHDYDLGEYDTDH